MVELNRSSGTEAARPAGRVRASKTRVYIADDQVLLRRGLASAIRGERDLELCGETSNCRTARAEVCKLRPDVVIMELSVEGDRGVELIQDIKAIHPEIGVVVLSRFNESVHAIPALRAGAIAFVTKDASPARVLDAIRKARAGQMCVSDLVASLLLERVASGHGIESFSPDSSLSSRELEIFRLLGAGISTRDIAENLNISIKTVEAHRAHIKDKASVNSGFALLQLAMRWSGANDVLST